MNTKITIDEIKTLMDKLLEATHSLAKSHPTAEKDKFYIRVIEGIFRRNTFTFLAIRYLANNPPLADSAEVLTRKMIEDLISIEYMLLGDKEKMAKQFQDFIYIQIYQEIEQRKTLGYNIPSEEDMKKLLARTEKLKQQYWHKKSNSFMHSWSGKSAEQMWHQLAKAKVFNDHDIKIILHGYTHGSWKNHPNPADTITYMTNDLRNENNQRSLMQATILSMFTFIRLTTRYIDELRQIKQEDVYEDVNKVVKEIFGYLDKDRSLVEKENKV